MIRRPAPRALALLLPLLAACGGGQDSAYPALLPLDMLTAEPAVPTHAGDAAADPAAVRGAIEARGASVAAEARREPGPSAAEMDRLTDRAGALRKRAEALRRTDETLPPCPPGTSPGAVGATCRTE